MENQQEISFRGQEIPEVYEKVNYQIADSKEVINKITSMSHEELSKVTIEAIHYSSRGISEVKLTTGDIIPIETAIALASHHLLSGYTTGATVHGGRTLRSMPDTSDRGTWNSIHSLPQF